MVEVDISTCFRFPLVGVDGGRIGTSTMNSVRGALGFLLGKLSGVGGAIELVPTLPVFAASPHCSFVSIASCPTLLFLRHPFEIGVTGSTGSTGRCAADNDNLDERRRPASSAYEGMTEYENRGSGVSSSSSSPVSESVSVLVSSDDGSNGRRTLDGVTKYGETVPFGVGDMVELDAPYHSACIVPSRSSARSMSRTARGEMARVTEMCS